MSRTIIRMDSIVKNYYIGTPNELHILKNISLEVEEGDFVSIVGASGSGKSTLMNMIGVLDRPTSGEYVLDGIPIRQMSDNQLSDVRNKKIGFVFQTFNLIPRNNALKNVELPMLYAGLERRKRIDRAKELLALVGMGDRMDHQPNELSGGQKQRVAIARALANDPAILLADEPTGALDSTTGRLVMDLFHKVHDKDGKTIVLITHNPELAEETNRVVTLHDGMIVDDRPGSGKAAG
ncbi:ABC transporter ATP-binding protein [Caproiciproducens sp. NJN-50]|uniref:ABC transporter ATP-binding protein n=1 Tax=Acutalibacteraceae TaxID=3082771 RepID=UPI000FFE2C13|nr:MULTISPECIES: ABC transporter ATP-binding protein [Acutalibacteraceae]QAT48813.1 ABC transporter ATP-binding protein [Caproiciproducens sp. NJN-50]